MTGEDGSSAQCIEDVSVYRTLPNFAVCVPADAVEAEQAVYAMAARDGPAYVRLTRAKVNTIHEEAHAFAFGKGETVRGGRDVTVASCGAVLHECLGAAELLAKDGVDIEVLNLASIKPLDRELLVASARKTGLVVTVEDHNVIGGLGSAVAETLSDEAPTPLVRVGAQDRFGESGTPKELYDKYGLSAAPVAATIKNALRRKR